MFHENSFISTIFFLFLEEKIFRIKLNITFSLSSANEKCHIRARYYSSFTPKHPVMPGSVFGAAEGHYAEISLLSPCPFTLEEQHRGDRTHSRIGVLDYKIIATGMCLVICL